MVRSACLGVAVVVLLTACRAQAVTLTSTPAPTRTPPITSTPVYSGSLNSPNGTPRAKQICYPGYMQWDCQAHFPNGNILYGAPNEDDWSPDNNYAVVCVGATHDSPCRGFEVWDMTSGTVKVTFPDYTFQWDPNRKHMLVYLVESHYSGLLDELIAFDPVAKTEKHLTECPEWFREKFQQVCVNFPGVVVGGQFSGLSDNAEVEMCYYALDMNLPWGVGTLEGNVDWKLNLRKGFGSNFLVTAQAGGYTGSPISYTVQISGTQAYVAENGIATEVKADHLDFHFEKSSDSTPTSTPLCPEVFVTNGVVFVSTPYPYP